MYVFMYVLCTYGMYVMCVLIYIGIYLCIYVYECYHVFSVCINVLII